MPWQVGRAFSSSTLAMSSAWIRIRIRIRIECSKGLRVFKGLECSKRVQRVSKERTKSGQKVRSLSSQHSLHLSTPFILNSPQ